MLAFKKLAEFVQSPLPKRRGPNTKRHAKHSDKHLGLCNERGATRNCDVVQSPANHHSELAIRSTNEENPEEHLYDVPKRALEQKENLICSRVVHVKLENSTGQGFGLELSGGASRSGRKVAKPLVVTRIKQNGAAHSEGTIQPGDRILALNSVPLHGVTAGQAQRRLNSAPRDSVLSVQYDVGQALTRSNDCLRSTAANPLMVEVDSSRSSRGLGVKLMSCAASTVVAEIRSGSVAERIGVLRVGDKILAIGDWNLEDVSIEDAECMLNKPLDPIVRLLILPREHEVHGVNSSIGVSNRTSPISLNHVPALTRSRPRHGSLRLGGSITSQAGNSSLRRCRVDCGIYDTPPALPVSRDGSYSTPFGRGLYRSRSVCLSRRRQAQVVLEKSNWSKSTGLHLFNNNDNTTPIDTASYSSRSVEDPHHSRGSVLIGRVDSNSIADLSGLVQIGDCILEVNHVSVNGWAASQVEELIDSSVLEVLLKISFLVTDTVRPQSGEFSVKLAKNGPTLGLVLRSSAMDQSAHSLIISDVTPGSVAHRNGAIVAGDVLCSIDSCPVQEMNQAVQLMGHSGDVVTLGIRKQQSPSDKNQHLSRSVFSVELVRKDGTLGINFGGSEQRFHPIYITTLREGGAALQSGQLIPGDRLLAVNGTSVHGLTLSQASQLIQLPCAVVTLLFERCLNGTAPNPARPHQVLQSHSEMPATGKENSFQEANRIETIDGAEGITRENRQMNGVSLFDTTSPVNSVDLDQFTETGHLLASGVQGSGSCSAAVSGYHSGSEQLETSSIAPSPASVNPSRCHVISVVILKDCVHEDFGLSLSNAVYEPGVYIQQLKPDGPADQTGLLQPGDRIIQVNGTDTSEFDCCRIVPLIASVEDQLEMTVSRPVNWHPQLELTLSDALSSSLYGDLPHLSSPLFLSDERPFQMSRLV